jgi:hypothetical protein
MIKKLKKIKIEKVIINLTVNKIKLMWQIFKDKKVFKGLIRLIQNQSLKIANIKKMFLKDKISKILQFIRILI